MARYFVGESPMAMQAKPKLSELYKSGVYAVKVTRLTPGDLSGASEDLKLGVWKQALNTVEKSAEGIVG